MQAMEDQFYEDQAYQQSLKDETEPSLEDILYGNKNDIECQKQIRYRSWKVKQSLQSKQLSMKSKLESLLNTAQQFQMKAREKDKDKCMDLQQIFLCLKERVAESELNQIRLRKANYVVSKLPLFLPDLYEMKDEICNSENDWDKLDNIISGKKVHIQEQQQEEEE